MQSNTLQDWLKNTRYEEKKLIQVEMNNIIFN